MQILFLGPPGSGKGTQCKKLSEYLKLPHLASGDLLRYAVNLGTKAGLGAKQFLDAGKLVPDNILIEMFAEKLSEPECKAGFILDGFPRNLKQAHSLDTLLAEQKFSLNAVVNLEVNDALLTERIVGRRTCPNKSCGAVYHLKFSPPQEDNICDICGATLIQRSDDREDLVKERLRVYQEQTMPLIEYYRELLQTVNAEGEPKEVFSRILQALSVVV